MKIGIIADTHDNLIKIRRAVEIFNSHSVDFVIHCGDFIAPFALNPFDDLRCEWVGVFGNNDGEKKGLLAKSKGRIKEGRVKLLRFLSSFEMTDSSQAGRTA